MIETSERFDDIIRVIALYQATTVQRYLLYPQNGKIDSLKRDHWYRVSYHHLFHLSRNTLQICRVPIAELLVSVVHSAQIMILKSDCSRQETSMGILTRSDWNLISGTKPNIGSASIRFVSNYGCLPEGSGYLSSWGEHS